MTARIRVPGAKAIGGGSAPPAGTVEPGQRPLRELARDRPVLGRADDVEVGRRSRGREPGSKVGQARARGRQFVRFEQAAGRGRAERLLDPALGGPVRRAEQQVDRRRGSRR